MTQPAKHTPGPWVTDNYFDITSLRGDVIVRPPLSALEKARMHPGERQANAHLIAAAPAMYEALQAMLNGILFTRGASMSEDRWQTLTTIARTALAQAEGRQS